MPPLTALACKDTLACLVLGTAMRVRNSIAKASWQALQARREQSGEVVPPLTALTCKGTLTCLALRAAAVASILSAAVCRICTVEESAEECAVHSVA